MDQTSEAHNQVYRDELLAFIQELVNFIKTVPKLDEEELQLWHDKKLELFKHAKELGIHTR